MPEKVLKRVDKSLTRILVSSDRKMEKVVPTDKIEQTEKTKQIEVRAGEEGEPSIVVSIVEGESGES